MNELIRRIDKAISGVEQDLFEVGDLVGLLKDCRAGLEELGRDRDAFAYAVWMVGNNDTPEDEAAWWADFEGLWAESGLRVADMAERGITVGQGFEATGLS